MFSACCFWLGSITFMKFISWLIRHNMYIILTQAVHSVIIVKLYFFLKNHHKLSGFFQAFKKPVCAFYFVIVFPSATIDWFYICYKSNVVEHILAIQT